MSVSYDDCGLMRRIIAYLLFLMTIVEGTQAHRHTGRLRYEMTFEGKSLSKGCL